MKNTIILIILIFLLSNCQTSTTETAKNSSFVALSPATSGINFNNKITETDTLNYFVYPYLYLGAGVATGDFNNDELTDIFFTGNMVENQLYQNLGDFKFKDISKKAGVASPNTWTTGVTLVDINNDGWLDIYTCVSGRDTNKRNQLFINNKDLTFTESAEKYGLADNSTSIQSVFFDYDNDGDLDCYVANYPVAPFGASNFYYLNKIRNLDQNESDHLYKNNGDGTFTDVSEESGIANYGLSLGISVADFDDNGFDDIYISNDFATPDRFFFNNGDGTFTEQVKEATFQTSLFGMGCDAADFNNDGLFDLLQVDMTPKDNRRNKENMASMNPQAFYEMLKSGFHHQYMYNALQLNRGKIHADSVPKFSNIAQLSDMAKTDWSWSPLFADLDNDGWKDVFITNGIKREVNNRDFHNAMKMKINFTKDLKAAIDYKEIPSEPIANYAFRNISGEQGLGFENISEDWKLDLKGFSHGSAFADFDNDGDLDLVINNVDSEAVVYDNQVTKNNYLRFKLKGDKNNVLGIGTKIEITNNNKTQTQHLTLTRGYQSAVEPILHFGLGDAKTTEKVVIYWSDGKIETLENIKTNQVVTVDYAKAKDISIEKSSLNQLFATATNFPKIKHFENNYDDYGLEPLLPYQTSKLGGHISVADVNGDSLDDFFLGNAYGESSILYLQQTDNQFKAITMPFEVDRNYEDIGSLFFDADGDKDLDLYVVSGGNEFSRRPENLQDRLYINDNGKFTKSNNLPKITGSGGRVKAGDFDNDGDLDLFICGRLAPAKYPNPGISYILENTNGKFTDVTQTIAPELQNIGMVTDALWSDYDNDKDLDLIIVGEWMPITVFENNKNSFSNSFTISDEVGWFYSLAAGDFDNDGDMDYVAGNLGKNYKYHASEKAPFEVFAGDFDKNGRHDIVLSYYQNDKLFPLRGKQCSSEQIPVLEQKYQDYHSFATSELKDIYGSENLENALHYQATTFASLFIENKGKGKFKTRSLPALVQISNIENFLVQDIDKDGNLDIILAGNLYDAEIETPRNDASLGLFLKGNGKGNFQAIDMYKSGLYLSGNVKSLAFINLSDGRKAILAGVNGGVVQCVEF